jgi:hypothetical protein
MVGQPFIPYRLFTGIFIPEALVRSKLVSPGAKMAYGRLARYAGQDGRCFPAVSKLAAEIGIGARQAQKYLAELEKAKLIRRRTRFSDRAQASNAFEFLWHPLFQERVNDPSGEGVNDPSPGGVNDSSPKESQIEESQLYKENGDFGYRNAPWSEANYKADYSFASAKPAAGSEHVRSWPQAQNQTSKPADSDSEQAQKVLEEKLSIESQEQPTTPVPAPPARVPPRPAYAKPWTAYELQMVRDCGSAYMEGDTPPANFESNCELAAVGYTAAEVIACLDSKSAKRRYRPGEKFGPSNWNWFYTVIREHFSATERGHLPENPAVPHLTHQATAEEMDSGWDVLD